MSRIGRWSIVAVVSLLPCFTTARADPFVDNFDMFADYSHYLYSATNATVRSEYLSGQLECRYWTVSQPSVWGEITYRYDLPFQIAQASWFGFFEGPQWGGQAQILASPDGTNWTLVASGSSGNPPYVPIDLTDIFLDSNAAFIRARLYNNAGPPFAQFARTSVGTPILAPNVYEFQAVPEPGTLSLLAIGSSVFLKRKRPIGRVSRAGSGLAPSCHCPPPPPSPSALPAT
jgi:hypothetical protein